MRLSCVCAASEEGRVHTHDNLTTDSSLLPWGIKLLHHQVETFQAAVKLVHINGQRLSVDACHWWKMDASVSNQHMPLSNNLEHFLVVTSSEHELPRPNFFSRPVDFRSCDYVAKHMRPLMPRFLQHHLDNDEGTLIKARYYQAMDVLMKKTKATESPEEGGGAGGAGGGEEEKEDEEDDAQAMAEGGKNARFRQNVFLSEIVKHTEKTGEVQVKII